jgi:hypothetical protein
MFTAAVSNDGRRLPYGFGWFVQDYHGSRLIWHHGSMPDFSALILKVPAKNLTLIVLANSDALSHPFPKMEADGDIMQSAFASAFVRSFVVPGAAVAPLSPLVWQRSHGAFAHDIELRRRLGAGYTYAEELQAHSALMGWLKSHRVEERREVKVNPGIYKAFVGQYQFDDGYTITISTEAGRLMNQGPGEEKIELFSASATQFFLKIADAQITFVRDERGLVTGLITHRGGQDYPAKRLITRAK